MSSTKTTTIRPQYRKNKYAMIGRIFILTMLIALMVGTGYASCNSLTPEERLSQVFTSDTVNADWFAPAFLAQVPVNQLEVVIKQYLDILGSYQRAEGMAPNFKLIFSKGTVVTQIVLDAEGRIAGFWLGQPVPLIGGIEEAIAAFSDLPGKVSVLVASDTGVLGAINPTDPMAVGSAFKMAVLAALKDKINAGELAWHTVMTLEAKHIGLPSGILQDWPLGSPVSLQTLATLMISISDNTATNMLIDVVGRETIEAYTLLNKPFLTTREAFALKNPENGVLLDAYRQGDEQAKRRLLDQIQNAPLPNVSLFIGGPVAIDIEWYFSVMELANLMAYVQDLPLMSVNPGVATAADWQRVAYKGGSEPGVINLTTWLVSKSGKSYVVSATWNDCAQLDENQFLSLYSALLEALHQLD